MKNCPPQFKADTVALRITAELREAGERVSHKLIARVMRTTGLAGVRLRRRHRTTIADPAAAKAPDLIGRDFTARKPNTKYVGDITCLPVDGGKFLYLATVTLLRGPGRGRGLGLGKCELDPQRGHGPDRHQCPEQRGDRAHGAPKAPTAGRRPGRGGPSSRGRRRSR